MKKAEKGDKVKVHYTLKLKDNDPLFDTAEDRIPVEFSIGNGCPVPGLEDSVIGMKAGEKKRVILGPEKAYGPKRKELIGKLKKDEIPVSLSPNVGQHLVIRKRDGSLINAMITKVKENNVIIDSNHPLAGSTLVFDIMLAGIV